jgi:hypothetical protein
MSITIFVCFVDDCVSITKFGALVILEEYLVYLPFMNQALRMKNNLVYAKHDGLEMLGLHNGRIQSFQFSNGDMLTILRSLKIVARCVGMFKLFVQHVIYNVLQMLYCRTIDVWY